ncbi:MAG: hypothetical protein M3Y65_24265 [Pseudomonadota bacterium]|nr:hypothetical protein [Pseudomonadota bacterium]
MSRSINALLLSVLVFPGAGHVYLKRTSRALVFVVPTLVATIYFGMDLFDRASAIANEIMSGAMELDPVAMAARVQPAGPTPFLVSLSIYVIVACWIGAAIDAWLLARRPLPR